MTATDPKAILEAANLTHLQKDIWLMRAAGMGIRTIARVYAVSPATIRDHLEAAERKVERAKEATA